MVFPAGSYDFDPATERLVQLFPFQFWDETAMVVGIVIIAAGVLNTLRSIAECEDQDLWQRAIMGVSQVGSDQPHVDRCLREVVSFIDGLQLAELGEERIEFLHY